MTALPLTPCCYSGVQQEGIARFRDTEIGGFPAYVAEPSGNHVKNGKGIIYFSDSRGIWHNSRLLADQYAAAGYLTVVCYHLGIVCEEGAEPEELKKRSLTAEEKKEVVDSVFAYFESRNVDKIGAVGYCAGAPSIIRLLSESTPRISAAFIAHPAGVKVEDLKKIKGPLALAAADNDDKQTPTMRAESEIILRNNGYPFQMTVFSHVYHGFAVRRAVSSKAEIFAKKGAFIMAITWIEEHLCNGD